MREKSKKSGRHFLRALSLYGLSHLDPVILAALSDEQPLLLIGAHGTAKSALLNRLAEAMRLRHRHYNASLISFDDLLGYPVPNADRTGLTYLRTENDLWDAESVFLDEISRCRPESQNKLFSVIHERRVQGLPLKDLRYRWAAMNPPLNASADEADEDETYSGSLPLDPALADRFPWVVVVPKLADLSRTERLQLITCGDSGIDPKLDVRALIDEVRDVRATLPESDSAWAAGYTDAVLTPLAEAGFTLSGRRAVFLARNILSVHAAQSVLKNNVDLSDSVWLALKWSLPQRAQGRSISESKLNAIHKQALQTAGQPPSSPWHKVRATKDPVQRIAVALPYAGSEISKLEFSNLVTEAYASLSVPKRYVLSRHLLPPVSVRGCVTVPTFELLSDCAIKVAKFCAQERHTVEIHRSKLPEWNKLIEVVSGLGKSGDDAVHLGNCLLTVFAVEREAFDPQELIALDREWGGWFTQNELKAAA
jgi:MoxR-like ATPase